MVKTLKEQVSALNQRKKRIEIEITETKYEIIKLKAKLREREDEYKEVEVTIDHYQEIIRGSEPHIYDRYGARVVNKE